MSLYRHVPHPHVARRKAAGPVKVAAQLPQGNAYSRFNTRVAIAVTRGVGSMSCAWVFAAIALISLPAAIASHSVIIIVSWVAQTFLQLVLLAVIIVGQNIQAAGADKRAEQTFLDTEALLQGQSGQVAHLAAQDEKIVAVVDALDLATAGGLADVMAAVTDVRSAVAAQVFLRERHR